MPTKKWPMVGKGSYDHPCKTVDNKWCVAIEPSILNNEYPEEGKCQTDDMIPFSKFIKVTLKHMKTGKSITEEFCVCDVKAHTYNKYPYDKSKIDLQLLKDNGEKFFESSNVSAVKIKPDIPYGAFRVSQLPNNNISKGR